jgi:hypothetical protein
MNQIATHNFDSFLKCKEKVKNEERKRELKRLLQNKVLILQISLKPRHLIFYQQDFSGSAVFICPKEAVLVGNSRFKTINTRMSAVTFTGYIRKAKPAN